MQLGAIQSLRALAALMVVVHHMLHEMARLPGGAGLATSHGSLLPWMAGVDLFFVISGFIMVHASRGLFGQVGGAGLFLRRRLIRIIPIYWAMTVIVALIAVALPGRVTGGVPGFDLLAGSFLFWPVARPDGVVQPVLSLGWTLNYEMLFYLFFALSLALASRPVAVVALTTAALAALIGIGSLLPGLPFSFWGQPIIVEFVIGMALGLAGHAGLQLGGIVRLLLAVAGLLALGLAPRGIEQTGWQAVMFHGGPAALLVAAAAFGPQPGGWISPRWLERLGDASYALYLTHPLALKALAILFAAGGISGALYAPIALAACCLVAILVFRVFEQPVTRALRARLSA